MAFTKDGANLVAGYEDGRVLVWTVGEAGEAARWDGHKDGVYAVAVIPGGKLVATGGDDGSIALWSWPEGWRVGTLEGHQEAVLALAATPDGKLLASGSGDATIKLWALPGGKLLGTLEGHRDAVLSLAISPDGKTLASGSADAEIGLWSLPEGRLLGRMKRGKFKSLKSGILSATPGVGNATAVGVRALAFSPDGARLYSSGLEIKRAPGEPARGAVRVWSIEDRSMERVFKEHLTMVTSLAVSRDGKTLVSGSSDRTVKLYPLPGGEGPATLTHQGTVYTVAVSPDGKTIATGDSTGAIQLWDLGGKSPRNTLRDPAARQEGSSLWPLQSQDRKTYLKFGYVDRAGSYRIAPRFDDAEDFSEDLALVKIRKQLIFVDPAGKEAITLPPWVTECGTFQGGLARVKKGKLTGYIDKAGRSVIEPQFSQPKASERSLELGGATAVMLFSTASPGFSEGLAVFEKEKKQGYIDKNGKVVVPAQFDYASGFREGLALVSINGKWGFIDPGGRMAIPAQYDEATHFSQGLAAVRTGRSWSYADRAGKKILAVEFDEARAFSEDLAAVRQGKLWGYIDRTGKLAVQPRFSSAWEFQEGRALVADKEPPNWDFGFINRAGKLLDTLWYRGAGDFRGGLARVEAMYSRSERHNSVLIDRTGVIVMDPQAVLAAGGL
ncbi:MAG: WG repeat-containing protein [Bryobacteraceae bacterium]